MKKLSLLIAVVFAVTVAAAFTGGFRNLRASLRGFNEVAAVSTVARGTFQARINDDQTIDYELRYSGLEGNVQQAHIHLGQKSVNGGITVFLCTNLGNGPPAPSDGSQPCPQDASVTPVTGTIRVADVSPAIPATLAARNQGLNTGEFAELVRAIRAGVTYANVHSEKFPGGEIRDQIRPGHGDHD